MFLQPSEATASLILRLYLLAHCGCDLDRTHAIFRQLYLMDRLFKLLGWVMNKPINQHVIKLWQLVLIARLEKIFNRHQRADENSKTAMLVLPFLVMFLVDFTFGDTASAESKAVACLCIITVNGTKIVKDTNKEKENLKSEYNSNIQKIEITKEFDLAYGIADL
jgi:hypothetical protein